MIRRFPRTKVDPLRCVCGKLTHIYCGKWQKNFCSEECAMNFKPRRFPRTMTSEQLYKLWRKNGSKS